MIKSIENKFKKLELQRVAIFEEINGLDAHLFNQKPSAEAWSVAQICVHLMQAEVGSLNYLKKKVSHTTQIPNAGVKSWFRSKTVWFYLNLPIKIKAPAILEELPKSSNFIDIQNNWASQRLDLQEFLTLCPDRLAVSEIWKHPLAGKMNIAQMLDFFYWHSKRHHGQIRRTLEKIREN
ncbi:MAG: hypothetical protein HC817_04075 [Saprospiraceae bacterium]|nr:hypothetical protein [Saprospiraceae bacterium]